MKMCTETTEQGMREFDCETPKTMEDLVEFVSSLADRQHNYGTACYAVSLSAVACFNYVAGRLGITGFQSSIADMDVIRRTRYLKAPFMLIDLNKVLYPQHNLKQDLDRFIGSCSSWIAEEAQRHLTEHNNSDIKIAHPKVVSHWKKLIAASQKG